MQVNFHTHTIFCDGLNTPEDFVLSAISKNIKTLGFSAHVPIAIENTWSMRAEKIDKYLAEISRLKIKYSKNLEIYCGFEMDYLPTEDKQKINNYIKLADYTIGSVHYLYDHLTKRYFSADGTKDDIIETINCFAQGDVKFFVRSYYQELLRIIYEFKPDIVGHFDIIKKQNQGNTFFNEKEEWYQILVQQTLDSIASAKIVIEVNTGGRSREYITDNYPSNWILIECFKRKIPIIISSDAHKPEDINFFFEQTRTYLKSIGFTNQKIMNNSQWIDIKL